MEETSETAGDYEALYRHLTGTQSRAAADRLFDVDEREVGKAWQPGTTEGP